MSSYSDSGSDGRSSILRGGTTSFLSHYQAVIFPIFKFRLIFLSISTHLYTLFMYLCVRFVLHMFNEPAALISQTYYKYNNNHGSS